MNEYRRPDALNPGMIYAGIAALVAAWVIWNSIQTVEPGHVGVAVLFGKVQENTYPEGFHIVNPLYKFAMYDTRQKSHKEQANVPSQDQLQTSVDVSVQYRIIGTNASQILRETGQASDLLTVHLEPKLRSLLREQGKTVEKAEEFFLEATQQRLQLALKEGMASYLLDKGIEVQDVLIRDITLPPFIMKAIESKKEREQEAEKQMAELERYKTEQEQIFVQAEMERKAAEEEAQRRQTIADAQAYEIKQINEAIASSPAYIQLQALDTLKEISKDPSSKIYFINGESPTPLPLMHMGDRQEVSTLQPK